ncbi:Protein AIM2 [Venturia nashicola]|uniref:Protein AIM2 n=1 Tax=Venturia nashicola TaxID=86259 RepID=A0A4Z1NJW1_9PEZI|nr:Protein AIM2 [Venturia nashicola]
MTSNSTTYLAKPSGACCLAGNIHKGTPKGKHTTIAGLQTYMATPKNPNGNVIIYYPDVYGLFNNALLLMDGFANAGYLTLGMDYFQGDPVYKYRTAEGKYEEGFDWEGWLEKHVQGAAVVTPGWVEAVVKEYKKEGVRFGCVGYCFGAPYVMDALAGELCEVGAFAHPAYLKNHHFENIKKPLLLSCAETDHTFPTESRNQAIDILIKNKNPYQVQIFSGVAHGFALRCNLDIPYERYVKEQSLKSIVDYFDFYLSQ